MALAIDFSLMHVAILSRYVYNIGFFRLFTEENTNTGICFLHETAVCSLLMLRLGP